MSESCLHIFRQASKNLLEKALHEKSKILIKGGVSKFRYFLHACQSGPRNNHSRSIHLSALPKHLGDWCLIGIVSFITNIFHRGGIIHQTETKIGVRQTFCLPNLMHRYLLTSCVDFALLRRCGKASFPCLFNFYHRPFGSSLDRTVQYNTMFKQVQRVWTENAIATHSFQITLSGTCFL